jgi:HEAT repeat protein
MIDLLRRVFGFRFDWPEFLVGAGAGIILYLLARRIGPGLDEIGRWLTIQWAKVGESLSSGATDPFREEVMARARGQHAARGLFSLEEVLIPPHLLAPPPDPTEVDAPREDTLAVVPNLPDWNVLSGIFCGPVLSLAQAASSGSSFFLTGQLGSGKSTALAYLALKFGSRSDELGTAADLSPLWVHAADLLVDRKTSRDPLQPLLDALSRTTSSAVAQRLPTYTRLALAQRKAILLLDGLDEMTTEEISSVVAWLLALKEAFPGLQVIAAGPARGYGGLIRAGLAPVALAPWTDHDQRHFLSQWGAAWSAHVIPLLPKNRLTELDPALVTGWLIGSMRGQTPLEVTLRTWTAYAGDVLGASPVHAFQAYLSRYLSSEERKEAQAAGLSWIHSRQGAVAEKSLKRGIPIGDLADAGVLTRRAGGRVSFALPAVGAFLAGQAMAEANVLPEDVGAGWLPAETALAFFAALGDASDLARAHSQSSDDPLEEDLLMCAAWLRDAPRKAEWRNDVLRGLAKVLQDPARPYGLRLRVVHALVRSGEPSVGLLFRRMLSSEVTSSRVLGALGSGGLRDEESAETLLRMLNQDRVILARQAASLALAVLGTTPAMEGLGHALLEGDEPVRMAVAEALACNPDDGFGMLKDAVEMDNLLTRRAAVFGLARVDEDWVLPILDKLQLEDKQWVVRGAAAEAAERRRKPRYTIRLPVIEPSELPWLVAYASREGVGLAPGRPAMEMVRRALGNGTDDERAAALEVIAWVGGDEFAMDLGRALQAEDPHLRDAAFEALWRLRAAEPDGAPGAVEAR